MSTGAIASHSRSTAGAPKYLAVSSVQLRKSHLELCFAVYDQDLGPLFIHAAVNNGTIYICIGAKEAVNKP
jgi:hypothetical protein